MTVAARGVDPVTARWSGALFQLARRAGVLDQVQRDVERLAAEVASPALHGTLFGAQRPARERLARLDGLLAGFHPFTRNFVRLLFDRRREGVLRGIGAAFHQRSLEERGAVEGVVESARALGSSELGRVGAALGSRLGRTVLLTNRVNPDLVGGVRAFVGAKMIDASVQGRLEGLRKKLHGARLP